MALFRSMDELIARRGRPAMVVSDNGTELISMAIRVDQGTEFVSRDLDLWAYTHDVVLDFS